MSKLYLSHITSFSYSNFVVESSNQIILYPYNDANQQVISHSLKITGNPNIYTNFDWYGNKVGFFIPEIKQFDQICEENMRPMDRIVFAAGHSGQRGLILMVASNYQVGQD